MSKFPASQTLYFPASNRNHANSIWLVISTVIAEAGLKEIKPKNSENI